jgi:hypothetical protein
MPKHEQAARHGTLQRAHLAASQPAGVQRARGQRQVGHRVARRAFALSPRLQKGHALVGVARRGGDRVSEQLARDGAHQLLRLHNRRSGSGARALGGATAAVGVLLAQRHAAAAAGGCGAEASVGCEQAQRGFGGNERALSEGGSSALPRTGSSRQPRRVIECA